MTDYTDYDRLKKPEFFREYMLLKDDALRFLFDELGLLVVFVKLRGKIIKFEVCVKDPNDPENPWDCLLSNIDDINMFFRTPKGRIGRKYESFGKMMESIKKTLKKELGAEVVWYEILFNGREFKQA